jgi:hypothetical protein
MRFLNTVRRETATYWPPLGHNEFGEPTFGNARELRVRWDDQTGVFVNDRGETQVSKARVIAGEDLEKGGVLWLGSLSAAQGTGGDPFANENAFQIQNMAKIPTIRADDFLRMAFL